MTLFRKSKDDKKNDKDSPEDHYIKRVLLSELIARSENKKDKSISDQIKLRNLKRTYSLLYEDSFYCPALATNLPRYEISRCIFCQSGHIELVKQSIGLGIYPPQLTELCDLVSQI